MVGTVRDADGNVLPDALIQAGALSATSTAHVNAIVEGDTISRAINQLTQSEGLQLPAPTGSYKEFLKLIADLIQQLKERIKENGDVDALVAKKSLAGARNDAVALLDLADGIHLIMKEADKARRITQVTNFNAEITNVRNPRLANHNGNKNLYDPWRNWLAANEAVLEAAPNNATNFNVPPPYPATSGTLATYTGTFSSPATQGELDAFKNHMDAQRNAYNNNHLPRINQGNQRISELINNTVLVIGPTIVCGAAGVTACPKINATTFLPFPAGTANDTFDNVPVDLLPPIGNFNAELLFLLDKLGPLIDRMIFASDSSLGTQQDVVQELLGQGPFQIEPSMDIAEKDKEPRVSGGGATTLALAAAGFSDTDISLLLGRSILQETLQEIDFTPPPAAIDLAQATLTIFLNRVQLAAIRPALGALVNAAAAPDSEAPSANDNKLALAVGGLAAARTAVASGEVEKTIVDLVDTKLAGQGLTDEQLEQLKELLAALVQLQLLLLSLLTVSAFGTAPEGQSPTDKLLDGIFGALGGEEVNFQALAADLVAQATGFEVAIPASDGSEIPTNGFPAESIGLQLLNQLVGTPVPRADGEPRLTPDEALAAAVAATLARIIPVDRPVNPADVIPIFAPVAITIILPRITFFKPETIAERASRLGEEIKVEDRKITIKDDFINQFVLFKVLPPDGFIADIEKVRIIDKPTEIPPAFTLIIQQFERFLDPANQDQIERLKPVIQGMVDRATEPNSLLIALLDPGLAVMLTFSTTLSSELRDGSPHSGTTKI